MLWIGEKVLRFFALSKKYGSVHALGQVYSLLRAKVLGDEYNCLFCNDYGSGNEKVARSVIHRIKLTILEDITDSGE